MPGLTVAASGSVDHLTHYDLAMLVSNAYYSSALLLPFQDKYLSVMMLNAVVKIGDAEAHYTLSPGGRGIYHAELVRFKGTSDQAPPSRVLLVRGIRHWTGSCDRTELLEELGDVIDNVVHNAPIFKRDGESERRPDKPGSPEK